MDEEDDQIDLEELESLARAFDYHERREPLDVPEILRRAAADWVSEIAFQDRQVAFHYHFGWKARGFEGPTLSEVREYFSSGTRSVKLRLFGWFQADGHFEGRQATVQLRPDAPRNRLLPAVDEGSLARAIQCSKARLTRFQFARSVHPLTQMPGYEESESMQLVVAAALTQVIKTSPTDHLWAPLHKFRQLTRYDRSEAIRIEHALALVSAIEKLEGLGDFVAPFWAELQGLSGNSAIFDQCRARVMETLAKQSDRPPTS